MRECKAVAGKILSETESRCSNKVAKLTDEVDVLQQELGNFGGGGSTSCGKDKQLHKFYKYKLGSCTKNLRRARVELDESEENFE